MDDNLKINYKHSTNWVYGISSSLAIIGMLIILLLGYQLIINMAMQDLAQAQIVFYGVSFLVLCLVIGFGVYLTFDFLKARMNMLHEQWGEERAYQERQTLRSYSSTPTKSDPYEEIQKGLSLLKELNNYIDEKGNIDENIKEAIENIEKMLQQHLKDWADKIQIKAIADLEIDLANLKENQKNKNS